MFKTSLKLKITLFVPLVIGTFILSNCSTYRNSVAHKKVFKKIYIDQFKLVYLRKLLINSFNNSSQINQILASDHSGFTEPILTLSDYKLIDSLTYLDNQKLAIDSANSIGRVAEGAEGKASLDLIIQKIQCKWLDSLARKRYKSANVVERFPNL
jgi:hypothetical protein